jgi:hypothetical protein
MDHLLMPTNSQHERIEVPLRAKDKYQGPFGTFLVRHGWKLLDLAQANIIEERLDELKCLLQTWLFFGLLEEVFGISAAVRYALHVLPSQNTP